MEVSELRERVVRIIEQCSSVFLLPVNNLTCKVELTEGDDDNPRKNPMLTVTVTITPSGEQPIYTKITVTNEEDFMVLEEYMGCLAEAWGKRTTAVIHTGMDSRHQQ